MSIAPDLQRWITEMERFCAYQERSVNEIRLKLSRKGLHEGQVALIVNYLTLHNFLNEQRFVKAYVQGKFNIKGWGKHKIIAGLKTHQIPETLIQAGLSQLETNDQDKRLVDWLEKKKHALRNEPESPKKTAKIVRFLLSKGYEMSAILELVRLS
jgi:regulatory protein